MLSPGAEPVQLVQTMPGGHSFGDFGDKSANDVAQRRRQVIPTSKKPLQAAPRGKDL
jgi:hypothetical protein